MATENHTPPPPHPGRPGRQRAASTRVPIDGETPTVALIPARGGSKGLPRKALRRFSGKPLIVWTIEAAMASAAVDRIVVSTDDAEIAAVASAAGAEVPWLRPADLATDTASMVDVVLHALDRLESESPIGVICLLQPTSPLRAVEDIDGALAWLRRTGAASVVSISPLPFPLEHLVQIQSNGRIQSDSGQGLNSLQRQAGSVSYRLNGAVYAASPGAYRAQGGFLGPDTAAWVMPEGRSFDIDTAYDCELAEAWAQRHAILEALA